MVWRRLMKKRNVLYAFFLASLLYCITKLAIRYNKRSRLTMSQEDEEIISKPFKWEWRPDSNSTALQHHCRNTVQGQQLVTDEKGFVCSRSSLLIGGCCNQTSPLSKLFECSTCLSNGCCKIYEHCVSCCLHPNMQPLLRKILMKASEVFRHLFSSVTDHFEFCLAKCRTSSQSVQHENSYKDPQAHHCYGQHTPAMQLQSP